MQAFGLEALIEPRIRSIVADRLGVGDEDLAAEVSLHDDLAADSLDLLEVAIAVEHEFGITVPERVLEEIRTVADLVDSVVMLVRAQRRVERRFVDLEPHVWTRVVPAEGAALEWSGQLTGYAAESIAEGALRAGPGARLEVLVQRDTGTAGLEHAHRHFARLGPRGIQVSVRASGPSTDRIRPYAAA